MPSTKDLSTMPAPADVMHAIKCGAILDAMMSKEQWLRCYEYHPAWSEGVVMGKYDSGGGDHFFLFFCSSGTILKGFDHESGVSPHAQDTFQVWPGIYDGAPEALMMEVHDPAVEHEDVTFCIWDTGDQWRQGSAQIPDDEDDGSSRLLDMIHSDASSYIEWAGDYYGKDLDAALVADIYAGKPVTKEIITALNPERDAAAALEEIQALLQ